MTGRVGEPAAGVLNKCDSQALSGAMATPEVVAGSVAVSGLRGVLNPQVGLTKFRTTRRLSRPELAPFVDHYWLTWWDLRNEPPYEQQVVPHPCVHAVFAPEYSLVHGVMRGHFTKGLRDRAHVLGVRFRPAGFRPFFGASLSTLTGRSLPMEEVFGPTAREVAAALRATENEDELVHLADTFLGQRVPARDATAETISGVAEHIVANGDVTRVDVLAAELGMSVRHLQRMFAEYVGVGPKWVILWQRIHDAVALLADGDDLDCARLAAELGYSDQAHFTRDFTATVGMSPARYARCCRAA